jgi:DHA3 family macrolide efflux protein-like MFS transporter
MQASSSLMVPEQKLAQIQGLNQLLHGGLNIASAPLGALLVETLPMHAVMSIDVFTALLAVGILLFIQIPQPGAGGKGPAEKSSLWKDFKAGLAYIWSWPGLVIIIAMAALINLLFTPGVMLAPILVTRHFGGQAFELALMQSSLGIGMIAGGLLLSVWGGFRKRVLTTLVGLLGMGAGALAVGLMPASAFHPALLAAFALGLFGPIVDGPLFAALQAVVAPEMQGRVFTVILSASSAMAPLGLVLSGPIADRLGVQVWFIASGIVMLLMAGASLFIPAVLNFEQGPRARPARRLSRQPAPTYGD